MNKCIKIESIYIFMINSYCKYLGCVSILNVDMAETMDTEAETGTVTWLTIDGMDHEETANTGMSEPKIRMINEMIQKCHVLLEEIDKDDPPIDFKGADNIINYLLGQNLISAAFPLMQKKIYREKEQAERDAKEEAQNTRKFMSECLGWIHPGGL
jgi:hypothetical protein